MLGADMSPARYLRYLGDVLEKLDPAELYAASDLIHAAYEAGRFVFVCGNGGSGATAGHLAEDLGKSTLDRRFFDDAAKKRLRVVSLADSTPYVTAWANDEGFHRVFAEQLKNLASPGDLLVALSTSGNSPNVVRALEWADASGLGTLGLTGCSGGLVKAKARHVVHVPCHDTGVVETAHLAVVHWLVGDLYRRISREDPGFSAR